MDKMSDLFALFTNKQVMNKIIVLYNVIVSPKNVNILIITLKNQ